jgi:hypothetical protein
MQHSTDQNLVVAGDCGRFDGTFKTGQGSSDQGHSQISGKPVHRSEPLLHAARKTERKILLVGRKDIDSEEMAGSQIVQESAVSPDRNHHELTVKPSGDPSLRSAVVMVTPVAKRLLAALYSSTAGAGIVSIIGRSFSSGF